MSVKRIEQRISDIENRRTGQNRVLVRFEAPDGTFDYRKTLIGGCTKEEWEDAMREASQSGREDDFTFITIEGVEDSREAQL